MHRVLSIILWVGFVYCFVFVSLVSGAHFIVGLVEDALSGESADGKTVLVWNPAVGQSDNVTDIVGVTGNSGASNTYLIDCELLSTPCVVGDEIRAIVIDQGDSYLSNYSNLTVTGAGFDVMGNLTLNSIPEVLNLSVDDAQDNPVQEIDLTPASTRLVQCVGVARDFDGESTISTVRAEFFNVASSSFGSADDNNVHYSNESCTVNAGYGNAQEVAYECSATVLYYANEGAWNCTVEVFDTFNVSGSATNQTTINVLLALSVPSVLDFGLVNTSEVTPEQQFNVTNAGNTLVNLSLSGYARTINDGHFMNCSFGETNISIEHAKYNLTSANTGALTLGQVELLYTNLTSTVTIADFALSHRQNDTDDVGATNQTYWRTYVPPTADGSCSGNLVLGAVQASAT